jgi:hypothetical protein
MKLAEAILEKELLDKRVELLKSRLLSDHHAGRPVAHNQGELQRAANQARDMAIAIAWTEHISCLAGLPLTAYRLRIASLLDLAKAFENVNREKADEYITSAEQDLRVVHAAAWLVDLKIPGGEDKEEN